MHEALVVSLTCTFCSLLYFECPQVPWLVQFIFDETLKRMDNFSFENTIGKMKRITLLMLIIGNMCKCQSNYSPNFDFALFNATPVRDLAKAVEAEDTIKIYSLVKEKKMNIDLRDVKFGYSLLTLAIHNNKTYSIRKLLSLGADPNLRSPKDNSTPFLIACNYAFRIKDMPGILSLLIRNGADANSEQIKKLSYSSGDTVIYKRTALQFLCISGTIECVKVLVDNGARLDVYPVNGEGSILSEATYNPRLDILRYLLIDKKVPIPDYCVVQEENTPHERKMSLRECIIYERKQLKDDHQLQIEKEILDFLAANGK